MALLYSSATSAIYPQCCFRIIDGMTETYRTKRDRMQKALNSLSANLRGRVALRNAEAALALTPAAQSALALALDRGLVRVARAIELLSQDPHVSLDELLPAAADMGVSAVSAIADSEPVSVVSVPTDRSEQDVSAGSEMECIPEFVALIRACYPDMPAVAAEALAGAPVMDGLRAVIRAHQALFASSQFRSDFVVVVFYGLLRQAQERLDEIISVSPAFQQALRQSGANWKDIFSQ